MTETVVATAVTAAATLAPASSRPAFRRDDTGVDMPVGGAVLLAVLVGFAMASAWLRLRRPGPVGARRWLPAGWPQSLAEAGRGAGVAPLRLVASRRLDGTARVHLLECEGRRYLIGCNGQHAIGLVAALDGTAAGHATPQGADP